MFFCKPRKEQVKSKYTKEEAIAAFLKDYEMNRWYFRGYMKSSLSSISKFDNHKNARTIKIIIMEDLLCQLLSKPEGVGFILYNQGISTAFKERLCDYYIISGWNKAEEYHIQIYGEKIVS
jgi:hypothetical protein